MKYVLKLQDGSYVKRGPWGQGRDGGTPVRTVKEATKFTGWRGALVYDKYFYRGPHRPGVAVAVEKIHREVPGVYVQTVLWYP